MLLAPYFKDEETGLEEVRRPGHGHTAEKRQEAPGPGWNRVCDCELGLRSSAGLSALSYTPSVALWGRHSSVHTVALLTD